MLCSACVSAGRAPRPEAMPLFCAACGFALLAGHIPPAPSRATTCGGAPQVSWHRDGAVEIWCDGCEARLEKRVALGADVRWIGEDDALRPLLLPVLVEAIVAAAGRRFAAAYPPGHVAIRRRVWMPRGKAT